MSEKLTIQDKLKIMELAVSSSHIDFNENYKIMVKRITENPETEQPKPKEED